LERVFSLRWRLLLFLVVIISVISFSALSAWSTAYRYIDDFQATFQSHYRINTFLLDLRRDFEALGRLLRESGTPDLDPVQIRHESLSRLLEQIYAECTDTLESYFQVNALRNALGVYEQKSIQALIEYPFGGNEYYQSYYTVQRIFFYMGNYIDTLQNILLSDGWLYYSRLSTQADFMRKLIMAVILVVSLLSLWFTFSFSRNFTLPIRSLALLASRMAEGELDVPLIEVPGARADEVSILTHSFNAMSLSIRRMVADLEEASQLEKKLHEEELGRESALRSLREAQLISLQTQIKPHFFFNALNTISRQAQLEKADQTAALIQSLAGLLRHNLMGHQKSIPLSEELAVVREYLGLQERRFGQRISCFITCSVDAESLSIPPLTLQPLVENAFCHGLEPLMENGLLRIDIRIRSGRCRIRIADNGVGIEPGVLSDLLSGGGTLMDGATRGIGVKNVIKRLNLYFGGVERFSMISRPGKGTLVRLSIPAGEEEA